MTIRCVADTMRLVICRVHQVSVSFNASSADIIAVRHDHEQCESGGR